MTTRAPVLEDFAVAAPSAPAGDAAPAAADRAEIYEQGYRAGWDDAVSAEAETQTRIGADFARTLQDISFSYHEARGHVLAAIGPLLRLVVERLLPDLARGRFAETVIAAAEPMIGRAADRPVELLVAPANRAAIEALIESEAGADSPIAVVEEPSLGPGQAYLRGAGAAPEGETAIDVDASLAELQQAVEQFFAGEAPAGHDSGGERAANG